MTKKMDELIARIQNNVSRSRDAGAESPAAAECKLCGDTGIIYAQELARPCACAGRKRFKQLYHGAGMAPALASCSFEGFRTEYYHGEHLVRAQTALQGARQFVLEYLNKRQARGIMFSGVVGSGKTYLSAAIANALLAKGVQVLFLVVPDFLDELRATYHREQSSDSSADDVALLRDARQVEVLVLDDVGAHNYTEWTRNKLYTLLNYRLNYQLPVIITTNLQPKDLDDFLGERTTSRIVQMCTRYRLTVSKDIRYFMDRQNP